MHFSHTSTSVPGFPENRTQHILQLERKAAERNDVYFQARGGGHESPGENPFERVKNAKTRAFARPHLTGYSPGERSRFGTDRRQTAEGTPFQRVQEAEEWTDTKRAPPIVYAGCKTITSTIYLRTCHQERLKPGQDYLITRSSEVPWWGRKSVGMSLSVCQYE